MAQQKHSNGFSNSYIFDLINCGEITRLWSQNVSEGNPCYNQTGLGGGDFTIQVTNQLTGNIKNFCVNISEYVRYELGDTYCDRDDPSGW